MPPNVTLAPRPTVAELKRMAKERGVVVDEKPRTSPAIRPWHPYRSKWEAEYARYLQIQEAAGLIFGWAYEPDRLMIGLKAFYTPDFRVSVSIGQPEYHEVKGYRREAAMVRLKAAALQFPEYKFVLVTKIQGDWHLTPVPHPAPRPAAHR